MAQLKITVGIPTAGRAPILCETIRELLLQTRPPDVVIVCAIESADLEGAAAVYPSAKLLVSPEPGLPRQRNEIIQAARDADLIVFFDDDFLADRDYIAAIEQHMVQDPSIVVATGKVLVDGIKGRGLTPETARSILSTDRGPKPDVVRPVFNAYGCNMALRLAPMRHNNVMFDTRLPLYGWQEDVDVSRRLAAFGSVVLVERAWGVHLGVKSGRGSGVRLGYSQVANPVYLSGKQLGYPWRRAITHIARNLTINLLRSFLPEPYVDRRGRLRGNALALRDMAFRRMVPERILEL